jgi:hypothetical protein
MAVADYFADCCPTPSLTQSIAKVLIDKSPLHAWYQHPRLNPSFEPNNDRKFDIGNVAHLLFLGRGKAIEIVEADDWRTKAAKEAREAAEDAGKIGVLACHYERARQMCNAASHQIARLGLEMEGGDPEAVIAWQEDGTWMRSMIDWLSKDRTVVIDFKTTAASASPLALPNKLASDGWDVQAAMHQRGLDVLSPGTAGRRRHIFILQECEEPYALTVAEMSEAVLTMGRKRLEYAVQLWRQCMQSGAWPGYPSEVLVPEYPSFKETQWLARELAEEAA